MAEKITSSSPIHLLRASFFFLLAVTLVLHALLPSASTSALTLLYRHHHPAVVVFSVVFCMALLLFFFFFRRSPPVFLLDYSCYKPGDDRKCSFEACEYIVSRSRRFSPASIDFMKGIYRKSGLGDETYLPESILDGRGASASGLAPAIAEAEEGAAGAVDALLDKTRLPAALIDAVVVSCGMFTPSPSLSSFILNRYALRDDAKCYNLTGMGCSSGAVAVDLAARLIRRRAGAIRYVLVVATENIGVNWYFGDNRSMLVTNVIFRAGCAAALLTGDPSRRRHAKLVLCHSLRTHRGADDASYGAAFQHEDDGGNLGVALKKDLVRVAGEGLKAHIRQLAPRVLPLSQLARYAYGAVMGYLSSGGGGATKPAPSHVPDFTTAFEHMCIHTGGKAVIESVGRLMRLGEGVTEPARMCLHRFGNTSSSLIFYELAYFEAKDRIRAGDRVWMIAFGTGFKISSLVWKAVRDSGMDGDNPWKDCIHRYPLKAW